MDKTTRETNVEKFKLVDYFDVWGNEEDGWEVNDVRTLFEDMNITDDATAEDIIAYLHSIKYLTSDNPDDFEVEWTDPEFCEIFSAKNGYPICRLEKVRKEAA